MVVKIEANKPADRLKNSKPIKEATKRVAWTNDSLPVGYTSNKRWTNVFIPHVRDFMDSLANPWELEKVDMVVEIQHIADQVYPDITHTVSTKEAVFHRVCHLHYPLRRSVIPLDLFHRPCKRCRSIEDAMAV